MDFVADSIFIGFVILLQMLVEVRYNIPNGFAGKLLFRNSSAASCSNTVIELALLFAQLLVQLLGHNCSAPVAESHRTL